MFNKCLLEMINANLILELLSDGALDFVAIYGTL